MISGWFLDGFLPWVVRQHQHDSSEHVRTFTIDLWIETTIQQLQQVYNYLGTL